MKRILYLLFVLCSFAATAQSVDGGLKTLTASGTDTYTISEALPAAYDPKERFLVRFTNANTGAATLNRATLGAKAIQKAGAVALSSGDIVAGGTYLLSYNGTYYQIVGDGGGGGGGGGTVTNVAALTIGTTGTDLSSSVANPTTTPVITLNVPTASASNRGALDSTDWSTFNNNSKQVDITIAQYLGDSLTRSDNPTVLRLANGNLVMGFNGFSGSIVDTGLATLYTSRSTDDGVTWTTPVKEFESIGTTGTYNPSFHQRLDGSVFAILLVQQSPTTSDLWLVESNDGGATFAGAQSIIWEGGSSYAAPAPHRIYRTLSGRLLYPFNIAMTGDLSSQTGTYQGRILKSDDDGVTWSLNAGVASGESNALFEPGIFKEYKPDLPFGFSDNLIMYYRTRNTKIGALRSTDDGATWSTIPDGVGLEAPNSMSTIYYSDTYKMYFAALNMYRVTAGPRITMLLATSTDARSWNKSYIVNHLSSSTITLTGTSGTANILIKGVNYLATFTTSLTVSATNFVSTHAAALLARGIVVTSLATALIFTETDQVFITNASGNLSGAIAFNAQNLEPIIYESEGKINVVYTTTDEEVSQLDLVQSSIPIELLSKTSLPEFDGVAIKKGLMQGSNAYLRFTNNGLTPSSTNGFHEWGQISGNGDRFGIWEKTGAATGNASFGYLHSIIAGASYQGYELDFSTNGTTGALTGSLFKIRNGAFGGSGGTLPLDVKATSVTSAVPQIVDADISPAALSANTDNYAPTDINISATLRISASAAYNLTGIAGGATMVDGRELTLINVGSFNITLKNDVTSTAANRFLLNADYILKSGSGLKLVYDGTSSRWRSLGSDSDQTTIVGITGTIAEFNTALSDGDFATVGGSFATAYVAKSALYTLTPADYTVEVTSGTHTQTLPTAVGITGRIYVITNTGSGTVTIGTTSSQTFANVSGTPTSLNLAQFQTKQVQSNGANWILIASF